VGGAALTHLQRVNVRMHAMHTITPTIRKPAGNHARRQPVLREPASRKEGFCELVRRHCPLRTVAANG